MPKSREEWEEELAESDAEERAIPDEYAIRKAEDAYENRLWS